MTYKSVPPKDSLATGNGSVIQHTLNALLTYHHGVSAKPDKAFRSKSSGDERLVEAINAHVAPLFFDKLFVMRDEVVAALRGMALEPLCVVHGNRGTGKSTIIQYIAHLIQDPLKYQSVRNGHGTEGGSEEDHNDTPTIEALVAGLTHDPSWYFYLDVEDSRGELNQHQTICGLLFDRVSTRAEDMFDDFAPTFEEYLRDRYIPLKTALATTRATLEGIHKGEFVSDEILEAVRLKRTEAEIHARAEFDSLEGKGRLEHLLRHLKDHYAVLVGIAVDNIDLFGEIQDEVSRTMHSLAYGGDRLLHRSLIGIRTKNLINLVEDLRGQGGHRAEGQISVSLRPSSYDVLQQVIDRRLELLPEVLAMPEVVAVHEKHLLHNYLPPDDPARLDHDQVLNTLNGLLSPLNDSTRGDPALTKTRRDFFDQLLRWHNGSLRSVAGAVYNLGLTICSNNDAIYDFAELQGRTIAIEGTGGKSFGRSIRNRVRFSRNFLIRQFVSDSLHTLHFNHELLIFERPDKGIPTGQLPYLRHHVIRLLSQTGGVQTLGDVQRRLEPFGAKRPRVKSAVLSLTQAVGSDERGVIHLDKHGSKEIDAKTSLHLLEAGELLSTRLAYMTDYIFWNAFNANSPEEVFTTDIFKDISASELAAEEFRISTAMKYVENRIVPRFELVLTGQTSSTKYQQLDRADFLERYVDAFGVIAPHRMAAEIANFAGGGRLSTPFVDNVEAWKDEMQERILQPFRDVDAESLLP